MMRRSFLSLSIAFALTSAPAFALEPPPPSTIQKLVGASVLEYAKNKGFSPTDPRVYQTLRGVSKVMAGRGVAVAAGAVAGAGVAAAGTASAPAWGSILIAMAQTALTAYAISVIADGAMQWVIGDGDTPVLVKVSASTPSTSWKLATAVDNCVPAQNVLNHCDDGPSNLGSMCLDPANPINPTYACSIAGGETTKSLTQAMNSAGYVSVQAPPPITTPQDLTGVYTNMTAEQRASPIAPEPVALMVNTALQMASNDPDYLGIQYEKAAELTPGQVKLLPEYANDTPTAEEFMKPQASPETAFSPAVDTGSISGSGTASGSAEPITQTSPATAPGSINTATSDATKVDLGPDPGITAPSLEATPTPSAILAPILGMMPSLKNYAVPAHSGECPKPAFELWGKTIGLTAHCDLLEGQRSLIYTVMLAVFGIASVLIVLRA